MAVASYVASQRDVLLGGDEVGYHVGQDRNANRNTDLVFATAGVLLEELKSRGLDALTRYKVVVIDECHERSCESDLALTMIREFMAAHPRSNLRLGLMSATFDHAKYGAFFRGVPGCEYVDAVVVQTARSLDAFHERVGTVYLEGIARMLAGSPHAFEEDYVEYVLDMRDDPDEELQGADNGKALTGGLLNCVMSLVNHLHREEPPGAIFLVFAPTYREFIH